MNWGYKILVTIVVFILLMSGMVAVAYRQSNELIDNDYYNKEIEYQNLIDAARRLDSVNKDTLIFQDKNFIVLKIPEILIRGFEKGTLEFLKISDEKRDLSVAFSPDNYGFYKMPRHDNLMGAYRIRILWTTSGKMFYREQNIVIEP